MFTKFGFSNVRLYSSKLKCAFFGSDKFSIQSLAHIQNLPHLDIEVITKPPKKGGRYLSQITTTEIYNYAEEQKIPIIFAETNKEINELGGNYDMCIAVSYGKLIPAKFLATCKETTLNVHPSLLPKYKGCAPIQWAMLNGDSYTGVSVQTLHPTAFDKGEIVSQSDHVAIPNDIKYEEMRYKLGEIGGKMLRNVLENKIYVDPKPIENGEVESYAGKLTTEMKAIDWNTPVDQLIRRWNVFGSLYAQKKCIDKKQNVSYKRCILYEIEPHVGSEACLPENPGEFSQIDGNIVVRCVDGFIKVSSIQMEGFKRESPEQFMKSLKKRCGKQVELKLT